MRVTRKYNDRILPAARKAVAIRLDSTPYSPPTKVYSNCTTDRKSNHTQGYTPTKKRCFGSPVQMLVRRHPKEKYPQTQCKLQKKKHPADKKPTPDDDSQAGLVPPPRARRFMIFDHLRRQNHADRPEGTRPLKTADFPAPRHTLARTVAASLAA